jgi:hypothetical protein
VVVSFRIGSSAVVVVVVVAVESEWYSFLVSSIRVGASEREASSLLKYQHYLLSGNGLYALEVDTVFTLF